MNSGGAVRGVTTASGTSSPVAQSGKGITTASAASPAAAHSAKGITTASGASSGAHAGGVVSADSGARVNGNAYGVVW